MRGDLALQPMEKSYFIKAAVAAVWQALVDPEVIERWGAGPAQMDDRVGTEFELWGGDIHGKNVAVEPERKLVQEWYSGDWPAPSLATFTLATEGGGTRLELVHSGVPESEYSDIDSGWDEYYLAPLKRLLEG
jgi:activator of HSP90 ATPase